MCICVIIKSIRIFWLSSLRSIIIIAVNAYFRRLSTYIQITVNTNHRIIRQHTHNRYMPAIFKYKLRSIQNIETYSNTQQRVIAHNRYLSAISRTAVVIIGRAIPFGTAIPYDIVVSAILNASDIVMLAMFDCVSRFKHKRVALGI